MGGDRFIPVRNSKQMDVASFLLSKENEPLDTNNSSVSSVSCCHTSPLMCDTFIFSKWKTITNRCVTGQPESHVHVTKRIQHWGCKDLAPWREAAECCRGCVTSLGGLHECHIFKHVLVSFKMSCLLFFVKGYQNNLKVLYSQTMTPASVKKTRYISSTPERILDAPELRNDFCKCTLMFLFTENIFSKQTP